MTSAAYTCQTIGWVLQDFPKALNNGLGNYNGASLSISRQGGAIAEDQLGLLISASNTTVRVSGNTVQELALDKQWKTIATYSSAGGTLTITFNGVEVVPTQSILDVVARAVTYANSNAAAVGAVALDWVFSDGILTTTATKTVQLDNQPPIAPTIDLTGSVGITDGIINAAEKQAGISITGTAEANSTVVLTLGSTSKQTTATAQNTWSVALASNEIPSQSSTLTVTATDAAGNQSPQITQQILVDLTVSKPKLVLAEDTGTSAADGKTANGRINVGELEPGSTREYTVDGGTTWIAITGDYFELTGNGPKTVQLRQTDKAGNLSVSDALTFTVSSAETNTFKPPAVGTTSAALTPPTLALANDTGALGDSITKDGTVNVTGVPVGATWQYSANGTNWVTGTGTSFVVTGDGVKTVYVHQTDGNGNYSAPKTLGFQLDTTVAAPTLSLAADTGTAGDKITAVGQVNVDGLESGATWEYSLDGTTWQAGTDRYVLLTGNGDKSVQVRQTDFAGNVSAASAPFTFKVDSNATGGAALPVTAPDTKAPLITSGNSVSVAENQTQVTTVAATDDSGQRVSFSIIGGDDQALFSINSNTGELRLRNPANFEAPADKDANNSYLVKVQAADAAGNKTSQDLSVQVTDLPERPSVLLANDTGSQQHRWHHQQWRDQCGGHCPKVVRGNTVSTVEYGKLARAPVPPSRVMVRKVSTCVSPSMG
jgi:hypothetical protein